MELKKALRIMSIENKPIERLQAREPIIDGPLDEAPEDTFPANDAVAIDIELESHDQALHFLYDCIHGSRSASACGMLGSYPVGLRASIGFPLCQESRPSRFCLFR